MFLYNTKITNKHDEYISKKLMQHIASNVDVDKLNYDIYNTMMRRYTNAYSPLMIRRYLSGIPKLEDINETMDECIYDISSINDEHQNLAENMKVHFNERQNQKDSMINKIRVLNNTIDDAMFINGQLPSQDTIVFRDSFTTLDSVDLVSTEGIPAEVSTREGVARLNVLSAENLSKKMTIDKIDGIGEMGNPHTIDLKLRNDSTVEAISYKPLTGQNVAALFDDQPQTHFEYSAVGVSEEDKRSTKYYDISWAVAKKDQPLRMRMVMKMEEEDVVNMITIVPFFNIGQAQRLKLISIRSSIDGIDYSDLFEGPVVINPSLNVMPDTYRAQNMYLKGSSAKLAGSGVFVFKPTKLKYIEFMYEQDHYYSTKIGHTAYKLVSSSVSNTEGLASEDGNRIRESDVPKNIQTAEPGRHTLSDSKTIIEKSIDVFDGWRYSIAIKDIGVYKFKYAQISEFRSIKYVTGNPEKGTGRPISKILLEVDELIPEEFTKKVSTRANYIQYYISFDDQKWIPISPIHRMPYGSETLPPKLIEINPVRASINSAVNASKYSHESKEPVYSFRLRAVIKRPGRDIEDVEFFSPILEEYRIKVELE